MERGTQRQERGTQRQEIERDSRRPTGEDEGEGLDGTGVLASTVVSATSATSAVVAVSDPTTPTAVEHSSSRRATELWLFHRVPYRPTCTVTRHDSHAYRAWLLYETIFFPTYPSASYVLLNALLREGCNQRRIISIPTVSEKQTTT